MKTYDFVLFDLDGTLTDPGLGITNSVMHALERFGLEVPERSELYKFIGPPLYDSFMRYYGMTREEAELAIVYYREHFADIGIFENEVYEGIPQLLEKLCAAGKKLMLATSKPEEFALRIAQHFEIDRYFAKIAGANMDETRTDKREVIEYALSSCGVSDKSRAVMVGDREYDVIGAAEMGLDSIGVAYGYGSMEELESAHPTYIAKTVAELETLLSR